MSSMSDVLMVQGGRLAAEDILLIRRLIAGNPDWSRRNLSEVLCAARDWRNGGGRLKDMATRALEPHGNPASAWFLFIIHGAASASRSLNGKW
jgi:hypothetical protein